MKDNQHIIVGTAGHVDHGKTELTAVLTGINTDRLPEEKKRGMTIVPGFVPLTLPNGLRLGLIDVPGHEKFVKNMLAGAAGMDMVMLVIAADEGVMPQTVEHLHILHLLGLDKGIVVITKADLVDEEWLELIREQVTELLQGSSLAAAPLVITSAYSGEGIDQLKETLMQLAATVEPRALAGHARLPIDRVFSKTGFGTVVTGTLWSGSLHEGQQVELWPSGSEARIRSLQVHGQKTNQAVAGQRTAVNLSGIESEQAPRGGWLAEPDLLRESFRIDIELRLLSTAKPLHQRARLRIHHGTAEVLGRVNLLAQEELAPGASCFAQLELERPLPTLLGDKIVLRSYSPMITIGGATVLDVAPQRHKRFQEQVISALQTRSEGNSDDILADIIRREARPLTVAAAAKAAQIPESEMEQVLLQLQEKSQVLLLPLEGERLWLAAETAAQLQLGIKALLADYHQQYRLRHGFPVAELKSRYFAQFSPKQMHALLELWQEQGEISLTGSLISAPGFAPQLQPTEQQLVDSIATRYSSNLFTPPLWEDVAAELGIKPAAANELLQYLLGGNILLRAGEHYFSATAPEQALEILRAEQGEEGFAVGEIRSLLDTTRKYAMSLIEYLDTKKLTVRIGDRRFCADLPQ
jgi:selenocysteine-specific elongation factor